MKKHLKFYIEAIILYSIFMFLIPFLLLNFSTSHNIQKLFIPNMYAMFIGLSLIALSIMNFIYNIELLMTKGKNDNPIITKPAKIFVATDMYKYVRNPIYLGHVFLFIGEFLIFGDVLLVLYTLFIFVSLHLFIVLYEEPGMKSLFGVSYANYTKKVKRWGLF